MKLFFRFLLILSVLTAALVVVCHFLERDSLPQELKEYLNSRNLKWHSHNYMETIIWPLFLFLAACFLLSFIGLYLFWRPARIFFCILVASGFVLMPIMGGPVVETTWASVWSGANSIITGIILYLIFTSPIKDQFRRSENQKTE